MLKLGIKAEEVGGSSQPLLPEEEAEASAALALLRGRSGGQAAASGADRVIGGRERDALEQAAAVTHHVTHGGLKHRKGGPAPFDGVVAAGDAGDGAGSSGAGSGAGRGAGAGARAGGGLFSSPGDGEGGGPTLMEAAAALAGKAAGRIGASAAAAAAAGARRRK